MHLAFSTIAIALAAFVLPLVARRVAVPAVVLEILFGLVIGPSLLGLIDSSEIVDYLGELGFLLLMFLSGFELDVARLLGRGPRELLGGAAVFVATLLFAHLAADALGHGPFVTLLLATTSVGLVVPTLRTTRTAATPLGRMVLISALLADFLTLIGVTMVAIVHESGPGWNLLGFPALLAIILGILLALRRLAWWYPERFEPLFDADDPEEIGIRACLALMFVCVGLSYLLGVEAILGAFLAGTAFAFVFRRRGALEQKLNGLSYGFLIPIFFINVGMGFELSALLPAPRLVGALALLGASVAVKVLAAGVFLPLGFSLRQTLAAGLLLSARLSLVIAVANLGTRIGMLDRALESQVVLLAVVTSLVCPAGYRLLASHRVARGAA